MESKALGWLRLLIAIPAALLVSLAVQVGGGFGLRALIYSFGHVALGRGGEFGGWLVKVLVSPMMAAAFVWTMCLIAPRERRTPVAIASVIVVGLWGALLIYGSVTGPRFHPWLFAMGMAGWLGGLASYWIVRRGPRVAA